MAKAVCPFDHGHVLATFHQAGPAEVQAAIEASQDAWRDWSEMAWEDRAGDFPQGRRPARRPLARRS